jgi:hypothetical protein
MFKLFNRIPVYIKVWYLCLIIPTAVLGQYNLPVNPDPNALSCACSDDLTWLRIYWNYRYHLIGDGTIKTQHFPTDCNFLTPPLFQVCLQANLELGMKGLSLTTQTMCGVGRLNI